VCGIFGATGKNIKHVSQNYGREVLNHRGPDCFDTFISDDIYLAHNRLSIIGLDEDSNQPLRGRNGLVIICNGEIYNYKDLKQSVVADYSFKTHSDTEVILALYEKYGVDCVKYLRGMFAFALWDEKKKRLFCARDRFGIKPFYYTQVKNSFLFASEIKALLPFINDTKTNMQALGEYLTFQYTLGDETLFEGVNQLMPGHFLIFEKNQLKIKKYWDVTYSIDHDHSAKYFEEKLYHLLTESIKFHTISDVPVGSSLSGGIDSSLVTVLGAVQREDFYGAFHGKFKDHSEYNENEYAQLVTQDVNKPLFVADITAQDFVDNIQKIIYHLDVPIAGPGSFPQFMVSKLTSQHVKVVLGGQGGDEIFGGYARYLLAYFEQTLTAAIDGTYKNGDYIVTPESIIPNLTLLKKYKPLIKTFFKDELFGPLDERYFRLIDRSVDIKDEIDWSFFDKNIVLERFKSIFNNRDNVGKQAYFDKMTHFDFKCLLPALLHVEDRMSMAHSVESRVPFLDHELVEFAATIPADIKFPGGQMKALLKTVFKNEIPQKIINRKDKMGLPVPLKEWFSGSLKDFVYDIFSTQVAKTRGFYDPQKVLLNLEQSPKFSRKVWGLLSLELWYREFHDKRMGSQLELWNSKLDDSRVTKGESI
jgi:asparagine synthase (glutamine-hydrolysing)